MRINSCPVPYLYLSFSVISSDHPPSFLTLPPPLSALLPPTLHSLLPPLYCTCLSNASVISGVLFILHPHPSTHTNPPNCLSLSCLSLFFFFLFLCLSSLDRGVSQQRWLSILEKSLYHVEVSWCGLAWQGIAATLSHAYTLTQLHTHGTRRARRKYQVVFR